MQQNGSGEEQRSKSPYSSQESIPYTVFQQNHDMGFHN